MFLPAMKAPRARFGARPAVLALAALLLAVPVLVGSAGSRLVETLAGARPTSHSSAAMPAGLREAASATIGAADARYRVQAEGDALTATGGGVRSAFARTGFTARAAGGSVAFRVTGIGRGEAPRAAGTRAPIAAGNRVTYPRAGATEWYSNGPAGLEQGFTLARPPAGSGELTVAEQVSSGLVPRRAAGAIDFVRPAGGSVVLSYGGLRAVDARGRVLPSHLELAGRTVRLRVDDARALYPVTIDPLVQHGTKLQPTEGAGNGQFGTSVAVAETNGDVAIVGAPEESSGAGAAWIFTRDANGTWKETADLPATGASTQPPVLFGEGVAIDDAGDVAVVGAPGDSLGAGAAFVYRLVSGTWTFDKKLTASDESGAAELGWSVALSDDGNTVLAGGPHDANEAGAVWAFTYNPLNASWSPGSKFTARDATSPARFGWSIAATGNGFNMTVVIGGPEDDHAANNGNAGSAWVYNDSDGWVPEGPALGPTNETGDGLFGWSVSISDDAKMVLIGAPDDNAGAGAVWAYNFVAGVGWQQGARLLPNDASGTPEFGWSVALQGNSTSNSGSAVIGGPSDNNTTSAGSMWQFAVNSDGWRQVSTKLTPSDASGAEFFGWSVAFSGNGSTAIVGGPQDAAGSSEGAAWVFVPGPGVSGESANPLDDVSGEVTGFVSPNGQDATYRVDYGPTSGYGFHTADQSAPAAGGTVQADVTLDSLQPNTVYHYRIEATSPAGTAFGPDETFTTGLQVSATSGVALNQVVLGSGTGLCPDSAITIVWGDGTPPDTGGLCQPNGNGFVVVGSHTYTTPSTHHYSITVDGSSPSFHAVAGALIFPTGQSLQVTTNDDSQDNTNCQPASCTLRQAIEASNAGDGSYSISVPADSDHYQLSDLGQLVVTKDVAIQGGGAQTTEIRASTSGSNRVLEVTSAANKVTIQGFTLSGGIADSSNGFFGGDVYSAGGLTLLQDAITNGTACSGGGVSNAGGTMVIDRSTVSGNQAAGQCGSDSGGVQNWGNSDGPQFGTLTITNSTIADNTAVNGGGVFSWGNPNNDVSIQNSTVAGNTSSSTAGGGLRVSQGTMTVDQSIVADNQANGAPSNCSAPSPGTLSSNGSNLESGTDCGFTQPGDIQNVEPGLGPLQDNNGPSDASATDTMAITNSSPAFDAVKSECPPPNVDQRGITRPQGAACDMGAFELEVTLANDNLADATDLGSAASGSVTGSNVNATTETGEQTSFSGVVTTSATVWWKWQAPTTGAYVFDTAGSPIDTVLGIYTGDGYPLSLVTFNDDVAGGTETTTSAAGFHAIAGTTYFIQVGSFGETGTGPIDLNWKPGPVNDEFAFPTTISGLNGSLQDAAGGATTVGATIEPGEPSSNGSLNGSVWYAWTAPVDGPVNFTSADSFNGSLAVFTGNSFATLNEVASQLDSNNLSVNFQATAGTTYLIQVGPYDDVQGEFTLTWVEQPPNDNWANATDLGGAASGAVTGTNVGASVEDGEPTTLRQANVQTDETVWWKWQAPATGTFEFDTTGSNFNTTLGVFTGSGVAALTEVASNDDFSEGHTSLVLFHAVSGTTYYLQVGSFTTGQAPPPTGSIVLSWVAGPANDDLANATDLGNAASGSVTGTNVNATTESRETFPVDVPVTSTVWWRWQAPSTGSFVFDTEGSQIDSVLGIYTGNGYPLSPVTSNDDVGNGDTTSAAGFHAVVGTTYFIQVGSFNDTATGPIDLSWAQGLANDEFAFATTISGLNGSFDSTNAGATIEPGEPDFDGAGASSVWYAWTAPVDGPATVSFTSGSDSALGVYTGSSVDALTEVASVLDTGSPSVDFVATAGTTYFVQVAAYDAAGGPFTLTWAEQPPNDNWANAADLGSAASGSTNGTNVAASVEDGEPTTLTQANAQTGETVWWKWQAPASGTFEFDTAGSSFHTTLGVFTGSGVAALTEVASNSAGDPSLVRFHAVSGTTYYLQVGSFATGQAPAPPGSVVLNWAAGPANDDFANAASISGLSGSVDGTTVNSTLEGGEPNPDTLLNGSVWYSWTAGSSGLATFSSSGSSDGSLAVFTGTRVDQLAPVASQLDTTTPTVTFNAVAGTTYSIQVAPYDDAQRTFTLSWSQQVSPMIVTQSAQTVADTAATVAGTINPNGVPTSYFVQYGPTTSYGQQTSPAPLGSGTTPQVVTANLPGLAPATTYHYRFVATNAQSVTTNGPDLTFTTTGGASSPPPPPPAAPPTIVGQAAPEVSDSSATVTASVNPNGSPTKVVVNYGTTASYGQSTGPITLAAGTTLQGVSASLIGLSASTVYHFQFVATNDAGTTAGGDVTLTTAAVPGGASQQPPPPPVEGQSVDVLPFLGTVLVNGRPLQVGQQIPLGAIIDATNGTVILTSIVNGVLQSAQFAGGIFQVLQLPDGTTQLVLTGGNFNICKATKTIRLAENARTVRSLWGNGKGNFQTKGRYAAATVRGTVWQVADRCDGTYVRVRQGIVSVQNFVTKKIVNVTAGHSYLAKPKK
jgi:hypothetical protein